MFIDQLTLFIVGEIAVVYVIITFFMFYRGRLYHVLVAILKEMRWERLRRQQEKQREMEALRAQNEQLTQDMETAGKTLPDQLEDRIEELARKARERGINLKRTPDEEDDYQVEWLRCRILELEKELLSGTIDQDQWHDLSQTAVSDSGLDGSDTGRKLTAEEARLNEQLERDVKQYRSQFEAARERIEFLEHEVNDLKSINTPESNHFERPQKGMYADELYRLKCDKYDMQENINQLKLKLQQMHPDDEDFQEHQDSQIQNMERYIKDADVTLNLLEKELEAVNHENEALETEIHALKNRLKDLATATGSDAINRDNVGKLSTNTSKQAKSVASLRDSVDQLRRGEDQDRVLELQESELGRMELLVRDSENCVAVLEMELEQAQATIDNLTKREQDLIKRLRAQDEAEAEGGPTTGRFSDINERQQQSLGQMRDQMNALREGGDATEIIIRQEEEIDRLERLLTETRSLVTNLEQELDEGGAGQSDSARADSNEDAEELEALLKQFMTDSQSMMNRLKELEEENRRLNATEPSGANTTGAR